jgi:hypothetical protein
MARQLKSHWLASKNPPTMMDSKLDNHQVQEPVHEATVLLLMRSLNVASQNRMGEQRERAFDAVRRSEM